MNRMPISDLPVDSVLQWPLGCHVESLVRWFPCCLGLVCCLPAENMSCHCNNKRRTNRAESSKISGGDKRLDSPRFIFFLSTSHYGSLYTETHLYFQKPLKQFFSQCVLFKEE